MLPHYFYDLKAIGPDGVLRWDDEYAQSTIICDTPELDEFKRRARTLRNNMYTAWIKRLSYTDEAGELIPLIKGKQMKWQAIRILSSKHSEQNKNDWWDKYQDAVFRVFMQPETFYDETLGEHKQWYLLCPEDCYLVNRYEAELLGQTPNKRDYLMTEMFFSRFPQMREARLVPVECCHHMRHETTAGELPTEL